MIVEPTIPGPIAMWHRFSTGGLTALLHVLIFAVLAGLAPLASAGEVELTRLLAQAQPAPAADPAPAPAEENELELLIIQALDQPTALDVQESPIRAAIEQLVANTGIPIEIAPDVFQLLPYGSKTTLSAQITGQPLRTSLTALLQPLGLAFEPRPKTLLIKPAGPLTRVARRVTWEELATLDKLAAKPWSNELFESLKFQFQDAPAASADANLKTLRRLADAVGAGTAAEILEHATDQFGWTWFPSGQNIAVISKSSQVERQLETRVSLQYVQISLTDALLDLAGKAGVTLKMDPGVMAYLPPQTSERFSLSIQNATVRQALEVIAGQTGLGYVIEPEGVRVTSGMVNDGMGGGSTASAQETAQATVQALRSNSIVGQITVPAENGSSFAFFIREDDLPPEVNQMRLEKIRQAVNAISKALRAEQPKD